MRVSCGCPFEQASPSLIEWIKEQGLQPIVTSQVVRCVYEGKNKTLGTAIVERFRDEAAHDIVVLYDKDEQEQSATEAKPQPKHKAKRKKH